MGANDHDCLKLERAVVDLASGKPKDAEKTLREIRDRFDELEQKAIGENALSMLTDANRKAYAGEDYEKVLIRALPGMLANLMIDGQDAGAYALQVTDKQQQIIDAGLDKSGNNPKLAYKGVAVGAYIHGMLPKRRTPASTTCSGSCMLVCNWQPGTSGSPMDLERARHGHHSAPGNGVVYVFTLVGVGPYKEETVAVASSVSLLIADQILSAIGKETLPPTIAPIKVPQLVRTPNDVANIGVSADGRPLGRTETITDVGSMAMQEYEAIYPPRRRRGRGPPRSQEGNYLRRQGGSRRARVLLGGYPAYSRPGRRGLGSDRGRRRHPLARGLLPDKDPGSAARTAGQDSTRSACSRWEGTSETRWDA